MAQDMNGGTAANKASHATSADKNHAPAGRTQAGNAQKPCLASGAAAKKSPRETQGAKHLYRTHPFVHRTSHRGAPRASACQQVSRLVP